MIRVICCAVLTTALRKAFLSPHPRQQPASEPRPAVEWFISGLAQCSMQATSRALRFTPDYLSEPGGPMRSSEPGSPIAA